MPTGTPSSLASTRVLVYGPAAAVKIWAAERFQRLERHVAADPAEGYGLHPAR